MARFFRSFRRSGRRNKMTIGRLLLSFVFPVIAIVVPVVLFLAHKGYFELVK